MTGRSAPWIVGTAGAAVMLQVFGAPSSTHEPLDVVTICELGVQVSETGEIHRLRRRRATRAAFREQELAYDRRGTQVA